MKRAMAYLLLLGLIACQMTGAAQGDVGPAHNDPQQVYQVITPKGQLNVREKPDAQSEVIGKLSNRGYVQVLRQESDFYQVQLKDGSLGWVMSAFLVPTDYGQEILNYRPLQIGSKGEEVHALKQRLLALGYYRENHKMSDTFNATCVVRVKLFQKQNDLDENGIATPMMQAVLYSQEAKENAEEIPVEKKTIVFARHSGLLQVDAFDWNKFAQENPGVCMCCLGQGCECCNFTGRID